jgi:hypothetical protein
MVAHKLCILLSILGARLVLSDPQTVWNGDDNIDPNYVENLFNEDTQQLNPQKFDIHYKFKEVPLALMVRFD